MHSSFTMRSMISPSQSLIFKNPQFSISIKPKTHSFSSFLLKNSRMVVVSAEKFEKSFVEEMRFAALRQHTKEEVKEGERKAEGPPISKWNPDLEGYLKFLVDSVLVYDVLERAVENATFPEYAELRKTGLERSESLAQDLKLFKEQGHGVPQPSSLGINYSQLLEELSEKDPQAFICHFYMIYFGHTAGGTMVGKKVIIKTSTHSKPIFAARYWGFAYEIFNMTTNFLIKMISK